MDNHYEIDFAEARARKYIADMSKPKSDRQFDETIARIDAGLDKLMQAIADLEAKLK